MKSVVKKHSLFCFILFVLLFPLFMTQGALPWEQALHDALQRLRGHSEAWTPLLDERLPRFLVDFTTGACLAVSGAVMQALFQNPLASPTVLGISSGSGFFMMIVIATALYQKHILFLPAAAIAGALLSLFFVYLLARMATPYGRSIRINTLVLTGISLSTVLLAMQGTIFYSLKDHWQIISLLTEYMAASSDDCSWKHVHLQLPLALSSLAFVLKKAPSLDILTFGEERATLLGLDVVRLRQYFFFWIALLVGSSVAAIGNIPFYGLVLPHILRRIFGSAHTTLLPFCIMYGGLFLCLCDYLLRLFPQVQLTIGHLSSFFGGIFFLSLLYQESKWRTAHAH